MTENITVLADDVATYTDVNFSRVASTKISSTYGAPSCCCLVCGKKKHSNATLVDSSIAWLCEECQSALQQVVNVINNKE